MISHRHLYKNTACHFSLLIAIRALKKKKRESGVSRKDARTYSKHIHIHSNRKNTVILALCRLNKQN